MNPLGKVFVAAVISLLVSTPTLILGQEPQKAVLFDEFGSPDCENLWARLDGVMHELSFKPTSTATVEISGIASDVHVNFYWENMIRGYFIRRNLPQDRWIVRRTALGKERRVRFWITPSGGVLPEIQEAEWDMKYPVGTKPFIFTNGRSYSVEVGVCLDVNEIALLAKALESNPDARINVVLIVGSDRECLRRRRETIKELVEVYSMERSRIRMFKKLSSKPNPYGIHPTAEYWLVP